VTDSVVVVLHDLIDLLIDVGNPWLDDVIGSLGDVPELVSRSSSAHMQKGVKRPKVRISHTPRLPSNGLRKLNREVLIGQAVLLDRRYGVQLKSATAGDLSLQVDNACLEWLTWVMQLALLKAHTTFIHAVGIEVAGKALLFPSWGGVGKTAIAKGFVKDLGWRLLGDDFVILSEDGKCYGFPKPMVIYPYHKNVFPELFAGGKSPVAPVGLNSLLTLAAPVVKSILRPFPGILQFARRHNPQSVRVKPSEVFGKERLSPSARLRTVVWLDRVQGVSEPTLMPAGEALSSRIFGSTLHEQDPWCVNLTHVACGLGIISAHDVYSVWINVLEKGLMHAEGWVLYIPANMPVQDVFPAVEDTLKPVLEKTF